MGRYVHCTCMSVFANGRCMFLLQGLCSHCTVYMYVYAHVYWCQYVQDLLVTVFEDGRLITEYSFDEIRERAEIQLIKQQTQAV